MMLCYGHSRPAPVAARPAENVIMVSVANFFGRTELVDRGSTWGTTHRQQLAAWGKLAHHVMWRPNTGSPAGWQQGLPDLSIAQTIENIKFAAENRCGRYLHRLGVGTLGDAGTTILCDGTVVLGSGKNGQAILDDYYRRAFGSAAADVRDYFETIESARMTYVKNHGYGGGVFNFPRLYTDDLLSEAGEHLREAAVKTEDVPGNLSQTCGVRSSGPDLHGIAHRNASRPWNPTGGRKTTGLRNRC